VDGSVGWGHQYDVVVVPNNCDPLGWLLREGAGRFTLGRELGEVLGDVLRLTLGSEMLCRRSNTGRVEHRRVLGITLGNPLGSLLGDPLRSQLEAQQILQVLLQHLILQ
jgi:hypothetical protein